MTITLNADVEELVNYSLNIGYTRFKIISQTSFRELANQDSLIDRAKLRARR